jgi:hypothetical protein
VTVCDTLGVHRIFVGIEKDEEMNFGSEAREIGRHIVDIDGCLRATDKTHLTVSDILTLHGGMGSSTMDVIWEVNGETIPLSARDRVQIDENSVAFFRTSRGSRFFRVPFGGAPFDRPSASVHSGHVSLAA